MMIQMQVSTITERFATANVLIGERDEYWLYAGLGYASVVHDPNNRKGGRASSRLSLGKTFHDDGGRGPKEEQIAAHYKRHGAVLADCVKELAAMIGVKQQIAP